MKYYTVATSDPFQSYESMSHGKGKPVPEPSSFGMIFVLLIVLVAISLRAFLRKRWDSLSKDKTSQVLDKKQNTNL